MVVVDELSSRGIVAVVAAVVVVAVFEVIRVLLAEEKDAAADHGWVVKIPSRNRNAKLYS